MKICYIINNTPNSQIQEETLFSLSQRRFDIRIILLNPEDSDFETNLKKGGLTVHKIPFRSKIWLPLYWLRVWFLILKIRPALTHSSLHWGGIIGTTASFFAGVRKRIYTRHYTNFHHKYSPKGVFGDKLIHAFSTKIVAVSPVVKKVLVELERVLTNKIVVIPHGFTPPTEKNIAHYIIEKYNLKNRTPIIGTICRYEDWKGLQYVALAVNKLLKVYPNLVWINANSVGVYRDEILKLLDHPNMLTEIQFEHDKYALYRSFDVYVHTPIDEVSEAFGMVYIEGMLSEKPCVFTKSGIMASIEKLPSNVKMVPHKDVDTLYEAIISALENSMKKPDLSEIKKVFAFETMMDRFEKLYKNE